MEANKRVSVEVLNGAFIVTARWVGSKPPPWGNDKCGHHIIAIKNNEDGCKYSVDYWASVSDPVINRPAMVYDALHCIAMDAYAGMSDFEDFCQELGFDSESPKDFKTYRACAARAENLDAIGFDYREYMEEYEEKYNEVR